MKTPKNVCFLVLCLCFSVFINAQSIADRESIKKQTNLKTLQKIIDKSDDLDLANKAKAKKQKISKTRTTKDGRLGVFFGFDSNGNPVYAYDDNVNAAKTGRTDKIWQGGSSGLNLSGSGIEIGVWESGYARATHVEFGGRASNGGDGGSVTSHGTHTGGTLIAQGTDPGARGMASGATIKNYTASGMVAETAAFAAAGGILTNNSNTPGGTRGQYNTVARDMDEVTYNAPFYLHCKSAGNDGDDGKLYGVLFSTQLSKNLLVVGNSRDVSSYTGPSSVRMNSSSSFGPSDDWRIKPDITNNGTSLYSSDSENDTDYGRKSGTSMSTPATAGSIALLQQHYRNLNGVYMRAATAKALIINSADEIGPNDGPDFASGWGLVNAERAAQIISNNGVSSIMEELTISNGGVYTKTIVSDGSTPLDLTIVWNDPAGSRNTGTTPVLVNDLDVRVTGNGNTYLPWVMVPNATFDNYTDPAQRGDNFRDNVEKIDAVLAAGTYTIIVSHKNSLTNGSQDFSLVVNGASASSNRDTQSPSTPTNLSAFNTKSASTLLTWGASTDNVGVALYEIFQNGFSIGTSNTTNFYVTGLNAETTYSFTVNAKDAAGNTSGNSNAVNVTTAAACSGAFSLPYSESFESGFGGWANATGDDIDWARLSNATPSTGTGPSAALNGSYYLYTEASSFVDPPGSPNKTAILNSPCIDLNQGDNSTLEFGYHMLGTDIGTLEVLISTDNGANYSPIWSLSGPQGDVWNQAIIDLSGYTGNEIKLQFKVITGDSWRGDIAIDYIKIGATGSSNCNGITSFPYNESFEFGLGGWIQETADDINWTINSNGTSSSNTGPSSASNGNNYIYTEASVEGTGYPNKVALLTSTCIDLTNQSNSRLTFNYHMYGFHMGTLEFRISTDDGNSWTTIWSKSGDQGNNWHSAIVDLSAYDRSVVKLQIRGTTGSSFRGDMAVDAIAITSFSGDNEVSTDDDIVNASVEKLVVYPNPISSGLLNIKHLKASKGNEAANIIITDFLGKRIDAFSSNTETTTYNTSKLSKGVYFVVVKTQQGTLTRKFIKN